MAPHPAFLTTKGINAVVNLAYIQGKIKGVKFNPKTPAIGVPGCIIVEGAKTSCGLCRFHFANTELGGCEGMADYFTSSDEETGLDDFVDAAGADVNTASDTLDGVSLLQGQSKRGSSAGPSPQDGVNATLPPSQPLRERAPNTT